jgi:hypothetical protein
MSNFQSLDGARFGFPADTSEEEAEEEDRLASKLTPKATAAPLVPVLDPVMEGGIVAHPLSLPPIPPSLSLVSNMLFRIRDHWSFPLF